MRSRIIARVGIALTILCITGWIAAEIHIELPSFKDSSTDTEIELPSVALPTGSTSGTDTEFLIDVNESLLKGNDELQSILRQWQKVNSDVGFLISIPELEIEEPVVCGVADNKEYLRTNLLGESDLAGSVFLDYRCNLDFCLTKLIHGHNMKSGAMFGNLPKVLGLDSCESAPLITLTFPEGIATYEICAILSVNSKEEALPISLFDTREETLEMLYDLTMRSLVPDGVVHSEDSVILNTCWYGESGMEHNLHCIAVATRLP